MERAGTATFFQRFELTQRLEDMVRPVLEDAGVRIDDFGQDGILGDNGSLSALMKRLKSKKSSAALVVKFAPDLLCAIPEQNELFFIDIKTSLTPVLFDSKLEEVREASGIPDLSRTRVGLVEREAWDNYRNRFPSERTAILMACPYHQRLLVIEWAANIQGLFRFEGEINRNAAGSMTPHENIDLDSMRPVDQFFEDEFGIHIPDDDYELMIEFVKEWPLSNPGRPWRQFNACITKLQPECPWLRRRNKGGWIDPPGEMPVLDI